MKKRHLLLKLFIFFTFLPSSIHANEEYKVQAFDIIHIRIVGNPELYLIDTLDANGDLKMLGRQDTIVFQLKEKTLLEAGNEIIYEMKKFYRMTHRGFYMYIFPRKDNYEKKLIIDGYEIRDQLIPYNYLLQEFNFNDSIFEVGKVYRDYSLSFILQDELSKESISRLNELNRFLKKEESISIEIGVFLDNRIEKVFSKRHSQDRADNIKRHLVLMGIDESRLIAKGYEDENPLIKSPQSEKQHQKNCRVEFRIVKLDN